MQKLEKGVAAVEFGILLIPLVVLAFGITEFGRAIYTYNTLTKSVRDAARYLTTQTPGDANEHTTAKCMAVYGKPSCDNTDTPLAPGLNLGMVETCDQVLSCNGVTTSLTTGSGTINLVVVRIHGYPYNSIVEFVMPDITFGNISTSMRGQL
ncbi:TadE/TadG family type IV pilus assembly protein [Propionivibrio sp.]|uniref:TadE/TadG family type IV pilus assembly protein n=1 Tax=Propionivibrio sp. TaxID=2212460 RepID=UPI00272E7F3B|nr:TadE family protein [Propionivibrio sp.]